LTLNFDKFAEGQDFHGFRKISLNNSVQDRSYLSEKISREMFEAAGVPVPRADHAKVELNGRDLGLYVLVEGYNKQFLKRYFHNTKGNLYDGGFLREVTDELTANSGDKPEDQSDREALVKAAFEPDAKKRLARLEQVLDLDRFLSFLAMEVMLCHWDGYAMNKNNYRLYHDLDSNRNGFLSARARPNVWGGSGNSKLPVLPHPRRGRQSSSPNLGRPATLSWENVATPDECFQS
jgi:spore coat protein CotH